MAEPLTGVLGADFSQFVAECAKANQALAALVASSGRVEEALKGLTDTTDNNEVSWSKLVSSYVSSEAIINGIAAAWGTLSGLMTDAIASASESEHANSKLEAALRAQGTALPSVIEAYDRYATQLQQTTIYSDDTVKASEALLTMVGNVMPRDMEAALKASANLAAGLGVDLPEAAGMLSKALEGNAGALKKAGIQFDDSKGKAVSFGEIVDSINDKFGGQASAAADTYAGKIAQLENSWSSMLSTVGSFITQNETVRLAIDLVTGALTDQTGKLKDNETATKFVSEAVIFLAKGFDATLAAIDLVITGYEKLTTFGNNLASALFSLTASMIDGLARLRDAYSYVNPEDYLHPEIVAAELQQLADASAYLRQRVADLATDTATVTDRTKAWHDTIGNVRGGLGDMIAKLEATRGQVQQTTAATDQGTDAWNRHTQSQQGAGAAATDAAKRLKDLAEGLAFFEKMNADIAANTAKLWQDYTATVGASSKGSMQAQIDDVWATYNARKAAMEKTVVMTQEMYDLLYNIAAQSEQNIVQKRLEADTGTQAHYAKLAKDARDAAKFAEQHMEQYTNEALYKLQDAATEAEWKLKDWYNEAAKATEQLQGPAQKTTDLLKGINDELDRIAKPQGALGGSGGPGGVNLPGSHYEQRGQHTYLVSPTGQQVQLGAHGELPANWFDQYRGVSNFSSGPNAFDTGHVWSAGTASVVMQSGAVTMNYPLMNDPVALDQIGRLVGDAILGNVTRTGQRV